jgi:hypothetical protein
LESLRAVVEKLVQTISTLIPDGQAEGRAPEQAAPGGSDEVMIIETYGASAAEEEEAEPHGAAQD